MKQPPDPHYRRRFPAELISHAVWLYDVFSLSFRDVERLLPERGIFVSYEMGLPTNKHDEIHAAEIFRHPSLAAGAGLCFEPVHQVHDGEEPAAGAIADTGARNGNREVPVTGSDPRSPCRSLDLL